MFDGEHIPIATLPGMRERTVTISSGGKTFSFTGWKVGWVCAPTRARHRGEDREAVPHVRRAAGPFQYAIAVGLAAARRRTSTSSGTSMRDKRDRLCAGLADAGFDVFRPQGTYFVTTDIRPFGETDGLAFCRALPERCGVVAVPSVVFYDDVDAGAPLVRWACCKRIEVLDEACTRLKALRR